MSDETTVEVNGVRCYNVLRVPIDREVMIVTGVRPAVFDDAGNLIDPGIDVARLQADGTYQPAPFRVVASALIPAGVEAGIAFGLPEDEDE